jgi:hypothetical protein
MWTRKKWLEREREMPKYFIAYEYQTKLHKGKTNAVIETPEPIDSIEDINAIQAGIKLQNPDYRTVVIINLTRLED